MSTRGALPDHIRPGVQVLFVGINPGLRSAALGHHFAGYSNRFWKLLAESGLAPLAQSYEDDVRLPEWGFGITNLIDRPSRGIDQLAREDYVAGRRRLIAKIRRYRPSMVALLGLTLYPVLLPESRLSGRARQRAGLQATFLETARVFVLPNPSGRNAHYSYRQMLRIFRSLRKCAF